MKINKGLIIKLEDDNEYFILDKTNIDKRCFLYISKLNPSTEENIYFVEYKNEQIFTVEDENLLEKLLLLFYKHKDNSAQ